MKVVAVLAGLKKGRMQRIPKNLQSPLTLHMCREEIDVDSGDDKDASANSDSSLIAHDS